MWFLLCHAPSAKSGLIASYHPVPMRLVVSLFFRVNLELRMPLMLADTFDVEERRGVLDVQRDKDFVLGLLRLERHAQLMDGHRSPPLLLACSRDIGSPCIELGF